MSNDPLRIFEPGFSDDTTAHYQQEARTLIDAWRDEWHLEPEPELDGGNSKIYESLVSHVAVALQRATTPPAAPVVAREATQNGDIKYTYCFHLWPDETWGHVAAGDEHVKIPAAVFDLFRMINHGIEMVFTPIEFVRFRHDVESFGITLREITRAPYHEEEPVV